MKNVKQFLVEFFTALEESGVTVDELVVGGYRALDGSKALEAEVEADAIYAGYKRVASCLREALGKNIFWVAVANDDLNGADVAHSIVNGLAALKVRPSLRTACARFLQGFLNGERGGEREIEETEDDVTEAEEEAVLRALRMGIIFLDGARARALAEAVIKAPDVDVFLERLMDMLITTHGEDELGKLTPDDIRTAAALLPVGPSVNVGRGRRFEA